MCKTNGFSLISIMFVAMLLLIVFKIIVILNINILKTCLIEKKTRKKKQTCRAIFYQVQHVLAIILFSFFFFEKPSFVLVAFVLNIPALFCSLLNLFFAESVKVLATGGPTFGPDAMIFFYVFWACVQCQKKERAIFWCLANR